MAVIGGGPAGLSACLELAAAGNLNVVLFENEPELGGIPRSCHLFFGMRDLHQIHTGAGYARRLVRRIERTNTRIHTDATVLEIHPGRPGDPHELVAASPGRLMHYRCRFVLLATGCYEGARESRLIPGTRPSGILTTGSLQKMVNLKGITPGRRAVVIGTEHVAFSAVLTLRRAGTEILAMVEEDPKPHTYPLLALGMSRWMHFPVFLNTSVKAIGGTGRVEGLELIHRSRGHRRHLPCDTVIVTGKFRPESSLIHQTGVEKDSLTEGPLVDTDLMTSVTGIFAAGNVLRGANMHDLCALEGRHAARSILTRWRKRRDSEEFTFLIRPEAPIRFVVPQKILLSGVKWHRTSFLCPAVTFQVAQTLKWATIEAYSGKRRIWRKTYPRLLADTAVPLPVERFDWSAADGCRDIRLACR